MISKSFVVDILKKSIPSATIRSVKSTGGGHGNATFKVDTDQGSYFIKINQADVTQKEVAGLILLDSTRSVHIPQIINNGTKDGKGYLILEWIEPTARGNNYWTVLGENLAQLHSNSYPMYGLNYDNYIGSLPQINSTKTKWVDFFIECRLSPQLSHASVHLSPKDKKDFEQLIKRLPSLLPEDNPSLLHGDLWSGNVLINKTGMPSLIDPAVYYGNREIEIAFTYLFGGFDRSFYQSYHSSLPLLKDFDQRIDLYNLYPLLVHLNIFGDSYLSQLRICLKQYI